MIDIRCDLLEFEDIAITNLGWNPKSLAFKQIELYIPNQDAIDQKSEDCILYELERSITIRITVLGVEFDITNIETPYLFHLGSDDLPEGTKMVNKVTREEYTIRSMCYVYIPWKLNLDEDSSKGSEEGLVHIDTYGFQNECAWTLKGYIGE